MYDCNQYASNWVNAHGDIQVAEIIKLYPEILDLTFFVYCVENKPQGIIFKHKILQLIERGENVWRVKLSDIMSKNFCTMVMSPDPLPIIDTLYKSASNFIVFIDQQDQYVGVTTRSDIESQLLPEISKTFFGHDFFDHKQQLTDIPSTDFDRIIASSFSTNNYDLGILLIDSSYRIQYVNDQFKSIIKPADSLSKHLSDFLSLENDISSLFFAALDLLRQKQSHTFSFFIDGVQHIAVLEKIQINNFPELILISLKTDENIFGKLNTLKHFLFIDFLTSIPNRMYFEERFKIESIRSRRNAADNFALVVADIDDFKQINDNHGHLVGDQILQQVALRLKNAVRGNDTVARYGGDEFVLILTEVTNRTVALSTLKKISNITNGTYLLDGEAYPISLSFGVCLFDGSDLDTVFKRADGALYQAKGNKRTTEGHMVFM